MILEEPVQVLLPAEAGAQLLGELTLGVLRHRFTDLVDWRIRYIIIIPVRWCLKYGGPAGIEDIEKHAEMSDVRPTAVHESQLADYVRRFTSVLLRGTGHYIRNCRLVGFYQNPAVVVYN